MASKITWGILGGLGPVASAHFLKTIYAQAPSRPEQNRPSIIMFSDPTLPDRTEWILAGRDDELLQPLEENLQRLVNAGASALAICCVTMHHLLPRVCPSLRARVVSLLDLIFTELQSKRGRYLMLCSSGSRATSLFERHSCWSRMHDSVVMPDASDQVSIQALICHIKSGAHDLDGTSLVTRFLKKYNVVGLIAGCTEIHVLTTCDAWRTALPPGIAIIDPLQILAAHLCERRPKTDLGF